MEQENRAKEIFELKQGNGSEGFLSVCQITILNTLTKQNNNNKP